MMPRSTRDAYSRFIDIIYIYIIYIYLYSEGKTLALEILFLVFCFLFFVFCFFRSGFVSPLFANAKEKSYESVDSLGRTATTLAQDGDPGVDLL